MRLVRCGAVLSVSALAAQLVLGPSGAGAEVGPVATGPISEEFSGPVGSPPNPDLWTIDVGPSAVHGWERGSLQTYTDAPENVRLDGSGHLVIEARRSDGDFGSDYTSGRIVTRGKLSFGLGTIVARIKFPAGQGIWPAFWLLGSDIDSVGWPQCGEIDVMELINKGTEYHVALHAPGADVTRSGPTADLSDQFHSYWVTRTRGSITVGVDDRALAWFNPATLPPDSRWVFDGPMFLLLNVAVGGDWPGPPDSSTAFPAAMIVDWISYEPLE
jgi:beta-glucanase (GH16 family)